MLEIGEQWTFSMVFPWFLRLRLSSTQLFSSTEGAPAEMITWWIAFSTAKGSFMEGNSSARNGMGPDSAGFGRMGCWTTSHDLTSFTSYPSGVLTECCWWVHSFSVKPESPWQLWRASSVRSRAGSTSEAAAVICSDVSWLTWLTCHFGQTVNWKIYACELIPNFQKKALFLGSWVLTSAWVGCMLPPCSFPWRGCSKWSQQNREIHRDLPHTVPHILMSKVFKSTKPRILEKSLGCFQIFQISSW